MTFENKIFLHHHIPVSNPSALAHWNVKRAFCFHRPVLVSLQACIAWSDNMLKLSGPNRCHMGSVGQPDLWIKVFNKGNTYLSMSLDLFQTVMKNTCIHSGATRVDLIISMSVSFKYLSNLYNSASIRNDSLDVVKAVTKD